MTAGAWLELIASGLITGGVYALVALGLNLQYGLMRILNIAHGEFLMVGAFLTWMASTQFGISPLLMIPIAFALLMAVGLGVHRLGRRRRRHLAHAVRERQRVRVGALEDADRIRAAADARDQLVGQASFGLQDLRARFHAEPPIVASTRSRSSCRSST